LKTVLQYLERDKTIVAELARAVLAVKQGPQDPARRIELHRTLNRLTTCQLGLLRSVAAADRFAEKCAETLPVSDRAAFEAELKACRRRVDQVMQELLALAPTLTAPVSEKTLAVISRAFAGGTGSPYPQERALKRELAKLGREIVANGPELLRVTA
jgi:hypothetical protein